MEIEKNNVVIIPDGGRDGRDNGDASAVTTPTQPTPPLPHAENREEVKREDSPRRPPVWRFQRITVDEFRRRYFFVDNRPTRASVRRWIESGTAEGRVLPAYLIDGKYYIQIAAAETFIAALKVTPQNVKNAIASAKQTTNWREKKTNAELRALGYSFM